MDKPVTLSVKNFLIRKLSVTLIISERIVEAVVNHQYENAHKALLTCKSIELSGMGRFIFNEKKANIMMKKFISQQERWENMLKDETLSVQKRRGTEGRLNTARDNIKHLAPKLNKDND